MNQHQARLAVGNRTDSAARWRVGVDELVLLVAMLLGAALRLIGNGQPFHTSDHAELAAIVSFFYPRSLDALAFGGGSTWQLLTNAHGTLPPLIAMLGGTVVGLLGLPITEFWWNFPFVLLQLLTIPLAASLCRQLGGRLAGGLAALFVALLPIAASLGRASGLSHIPLTFACQLLTITLFVRYFQQPSRRAAKLAGLALALNLLVELFFPLLFGLILGVGILAVETRTPALALRLHRARGLAFVPRVMLAPLLVVGFNFALLLGYINGWLSGGGIATRLLEGSDRKGGLYLAAFWDNTSYVVGPIALVVLVGLGLLAVPWLRRLSPRGVPLLWSLVYLAPFVLFTRPHVYEYMLLGIAPLTLSAALVLADLWQRAGARRVLAGAGATALVALFGLRALSMIFGLDVVPVVGTGKAPGAVVADQGLKAAAWWVRGNLPGNAVVFADGAFEPYQLAYYTQHPFLAVTDAAAPDEAYRLLDTAPPPAAYLVVPGNEALLEQHARGPLALAATVVVAGEPALLIYSDTARPAEQIDAAQANAAFDHSYGPWRAMFAIGKP